MIPISTTLMGGLGNRLFQISFGIGYETTFTNTCYVINVDTVYTYNPNQEGDHSYFMRNIPVIDMESTYWIENDNEPCVYHNMPEVKTITNFHGYFQTEKYFNHCKDKIIQQFSCPNKLDFYEKYNNLEKGVFIHIRRGDYINNLLHFIDLLTYYKFCIAQYTSDTHFYICSNDIEWCKKNDIFNNLQYKTFVEENEVNTLWLMSLCERGGICANSTFSWWGGWLNQSENKRIYYPNRQFNSNTVLSTDLISTNFIKINV